MKAHRNIDVLVVDDQTDIRFLIKTIINRANEGLRVVDEASSGQAAVGAATSSRAHVIVMDQMMPGMTGIEAAAHILRSNPEALILLCTAYLDDELISEGKSVGIKQFLAKGELMQLPDQIRELAAAC